VRGRGRGRVVLVGSVGSAGSAWELHSEVPQIAHKSLPQDYRQRQKSGR